MAVEPLSEEELARERRLADQTWLPHYERFLATIGDLQAQLREAQETIDGMRREGCAAVGLVQNIFNGLTSPTAMGQGASLKVQREMADACAALLVEASECDHKAERDAAIERGVQACEYVSAVTHSAYSWRYDALFWRERTRAAERDAEAKGELAERLGLLVEAIGINPAAVPHMSDKQLQEWVRAVKGLFPAEKEAPK